MSDRDLSRIEASIRSHAYPAGRQPSRADVEQTGRQFRSIPVHEKDGPMMKDKLFGLASILVALAALSVSTVGADEEKPRAKKAGSL